MRYTRVTRYLSVLMFLTTSLPLTSVAADVNKTPLSRTLSVSLPPTQTITLPRVDNEQLRNRDASSMLLNPETPILRYAEPRAVSIEPTNNWTSTTTSFSATEISVWRIVVRSPGALSMNLGFSQYYMPAGGALFIYTPDYQQRLPAFTASDNEDHGQLWTPMLRGDAVVIEVNVPTAKRDFLRLKLGSVNHGYLGENLKRSLREAEILSGSCNVDVVCSEGEAWDQQIRSVAAISVGGGIFCTGAALNNTSHDGRGLFLTANHCEINAQNAASIVTYWNFQNSYCRTPGSGDSGRNGNGVLTDFNTGALFRASYSASDFTLVELDDPLDPSHQVFLSGWNANPVIDTPGIAIHHPSGAEKRISFDNDLVVRSDYLGNSSNPSGNHLLIRDWDLGTTEAGSSGSPLFDEGHRIIGQLHGGYAACGNNSSDWYGALAASWTGGGTDSSRVSNWLDMEGTGELAIDGIESSDGSGIKEPNAAFGWSCNEQSCAFDASGSTDSDGNIVSYIWDFGDGTSSTGINPNHTYSSSGFFDVTLTVVDNDEQKDSTTQSVPVGDINGELLNGVPITDLSALVGRRQEFFIQVPAHAKTVTFNITGTSGDADLYVRFGAPPTVNTYDCRPYEFGSNETCSFKAKAGIYFVMIHAYKTFSGVSVVASYD